MIIFYYLQHKNTPNVKTIALKSYAESSKFSEMINNVYFYLENGKYKLTYDFNDQEFRKDYVILKQLEVPSGESNKSTIGLSPLVVIEQCQKYIEKNTSLEYSPLNRQLLRSSLSYPLGNILFNAAYKNQIPAPSTLLSAPTLEDFVECVTELIEKINLMQVSLNNQIIQTTENPTPEIKFTKK